jgi:hypothetical protein
MTTGLLYLLTKVPAPRFPKVLLPHAYNAPTVVIAMLVWFFILTKLQLVAAGPLTKTGLLTLVSELIPTCPDVFRPQAYNRPVVVIPAL